MSVLEQLLDEFGISYITEGQNSSKDFVNIICQDVGCCSGDVKYKRGIHRSMTRSYCWSGGGSVPITEVVSSLGIPWSIWKPLMEEEADNWQGIDTEKILKPLTEEIKDIIIPGEELHPVHKAYLRERGFDPDFLEKEFGVKGITYNGEYYKGTEFYKEDFKLQNRVIIPIYYQGKAISYLGRSYLKDIDNRYMCCIKDIETYHHKHMLYNMDRATEDKVILCEGTLDVMNLVQASGNHNIVASFGTNISDEQLQLLRVNYEHVIILYDGEKKAQEKAIKIKNYMESYGKKATNICLKGDVDPGDLDQPTAKYLVEALLGEGEVDE